MARHGLAGDDGERGGERRDRGSCTSAQGNEGAGVTVAPERIQSRIDLALERGTARLLELQHPDGWWVGELESNATMIAQHLFWHHVLGLRTPELDRKVANELLARQREDGTWAIWYQGPADLNTTIEAYAALRLTGRDPGPLARDYIRREGGVRRARVFTKCFLALLGQWPWQRIPTVPVELILLPPWGPLSVYDFSCWARQTIVPLSVVMALRPVRPAAIDLGEIGARPDPSSPPRRAGAMRRRALAVAERWVRERQEADGSWGGIQPPWVWSIVMLAALGHGFDDETLRRAVEGWKGFTIDEGDRLRPEACHDPRSRPRAGRLGVRVRERPLPGHRRRGGRRARAPGARARRGARAARPRLGRGDAVTQWWLGRVRRRQRQALALQDPLLRLREGDRRADQRRDCARARGIGAGARPRSFGRARLGLAPARAGGRRLVVRPLGREPPLRNGGRAPRTRGLRARPRAPGRASRGRLARRGPERGRRLRRGHSLLPRSRAQGPRRIDG
ncbi:MAG: hypothetical protein E6G42_10385 [Actinobacteria bacterium]|nr:MAG: hypothetical protein E6G42_10385 [Actinomycetota bacterium]